MPINYIPNDPRARAFSKPRPQAPRKDRPKGRATFDLGTMPPPKRYPAGSDGALAWQTREAAFAAVEVFETLHGAVAKWARSSRPRLLELTRDGGLDLNAYYDREGVRFFHHPVARVTKFSGASAEIVSHEVGHALLDTIRPTLWDSNFPEVAAFHEAFGDCIAMLTAIADPAMRKELVRVIGRRNFIETFGEDLSWAALKVMGAKCNASKPRQARNKYRWSLPATLPADGRGGMLINEPHSFGQVFTGCFYDIIALTFARGAKNEAALWNAASTAARALFAAAKAAPITPRFYQAVGRAMVLHETPDAHGVRAIVTQAFANHGIALGGAAATAPRATIAGGKLRRGVIGAKTLMPATAADLRVRLGVVKGAPLHVRRVTLGGERFVEATHERRVDLSGLASYLDGVSATGSEPVLVAPVRGAMAIMSSVPDAGTTTDEVHAFVRGLVARDEIAHAGNTAALAAKRRGALAEASPDKQPLTPRTHQIVRRRGQAVLQRVRFACGCGFCACR
jgi:hypothetical protein